MTLPKDQLELRQERMRARVQKQKEEKERRLNSRPLCISCNKRAARLNGPYCSRCTASGMVNNLRDTLPGLPTSTEIQETISDIQHSELLSNSPPPTSLMVHDEVQVPPKDVFTRSQAAGILGISATTLLRWEKKGVIPTPRRFSHNNQCVYTKEMIEIASRYKNSVYVPPPSLAAPSGTPEAIPRAVRIGKLDKSLEKAVARRLGSLGRLIR